MPIFQPYKPFPQVPACEKQPPQVPTSTYEEFTLKDQLRDRYLKKALAWLLGYDENFESKKKPLPTLMASPWQTALLVKYALDARDIFEQENDIVEKINASIVDCIKWLLENKNIENENLYDYSAILWSLFLYQEKLKPDDGIDTQELNSFIEYNIEKICGCLKDFKNTEGFHRLITTLTNISESNYQKVERKYKSSLNTHDDLLGLLVNKAIERYKTRNSKHKNNDKLIINKSYEELDDQHTMIQALTHFLEKWHDSSSCLSIDWNNSNKIDLEVKRILNENLRRIEKQLNHSFYHHGQTSLILKSYIETHHILNKITSTEEKDNKKVDDTIVMGACYYLLNDVKCFPNGSIYHDLYNTLYFLNLLNTLVNHWDFARKPVIAAQETLLSKIHKPDAQNIDRIYHLNEENINLINENKSLESYNSKNTIILIATLTAYIATLFFKFKIMYKGFDIAIIICSVGIVALFVTIWRNKKD